MASGNKKVLVTGASGFVGHALTLELVRRGFGVIAASRKPASFPEEVTSWPLTHYEDIRDRDLQAMAVDTVIHTAARVHVMGDEPDALAAYRAANVDLTLGLARQAVRCGAKRFIFLSSIKVSGEHTAAGIPFEPAQPPAPSDPYGISKMEAEQALLALAAATGLEVVIIRPVLVYGPGVRANFKAMMRWVDRNLPLPFGRVTNQRSLVALENLLDLLITCVEHPAAANEIFLVSDDHDLSTAEILQKVARAFGRPARIFAMPSLLLVATAAIINKKSEASRLLSSLQVDISKTKTMLGWAPPVSMECALQRTVDAYRTGEGK